MTAFKMKKLRFIVSDKLKTENLLRKFSCQKLPIFVELKARLKSIAGESHLLSLFVSISRQLA